MKNTGKDDQFSGNHPAVTSGAKASEAQQMFWELSSDLLVVASLDGRFLNLNPRWQTITGYQPDELTGLFFIDFVHPDDVADTIAIFEEELKGKEVISFINRYRCRDGSYIWLEWNGKISTDKTLIYSTARDITQRKLAEDALKKQLHRMEIVIEGTNAGTWEWNVQTGETNFNERWAEMLGYSLDMLKPVSIQTWEMLMHPDDLVQARKRLGEVFRREETFYKIDFRMKHHDGHWVWIHDAGKVFEWTPDGKPLIMAGTHTDISARKEAEEALARSEEKYRLLAENITDVIWVLNVTQNRFTYISQSVYNLRGFTVEEAMQQSLSDSLSPESLQLVMDQVAISLPEFLANPGQPRAGHHQLQQTCKDGSLIWIETVTQYRFSPEGEIEVLGVSRNIENRKLYERLLAEQARELQEINAEKDKFFSIIAHDLKSPFNGFLNLTQIIRDEYSEMSEEEIRNIIRILAAQASNLYRLLVNLLEWSKLQRGLVQPVYTRVQVKNIVDFNFALVQEALSKKNLTAVNDIPDSLFVQTDEHMFDLIIRNLLSNAVKFSTSGGTIKVSCVNPATGMVEIIVSDTGIGMSPHIQENLFKLGTDTMRKGTANESSTGLGLFLCKDYVEMNGGILTAESKEGKGSVFRFTVPLAKAERSNKRSMIQPVTPARQKQMLRALLVDNDPASEMVIAHSMKKFGITVLTADNSDQALALCRNNPDTDLILMDLHIPETNGIVTARKIREFNKNAVIIVQTDNFYQAEKELAIATGCNEYILKPDVAEELHRIILKYYGQRLSES